MGKDRGPPTALQVEVRRARDLHDTSLLGKMDPFVEVSVGTKKQKSQTHSKGGRFPTWNQTLTFTYDNEPTIQFRVIDKDTISNDYIGVHDLHLAPIVGGEREFDGELPLSRKKGKPAGYVHVRLKFYGEVGGDCDDTSGVPKKDSTPAPSVPSYPPQPVPAPYAPAAGVVPVAVAPPAPAPYYPAPVQPVYQPAAPNPYAAPPQRPYGGGVHVVVGGAPPSYPGQPGYPPQQPSYPPQPHPAAPYNPYGPPPNPYAPPPQPNLYAPQYHQQAPPQYYAPPPLSSKKKKKHKKRSSSSSSSSS